MNVDVSVIMPVHNGERFIGEAVESVLAQTHTSFELIVVDDGSIDNTLAIVREYANQDSRVRVTATESASGGPAVPRNLGLELASGSYIALLDSDDIWSANKLELQLSFMRENRAVLSYTAYRRITEDGQRIQDVQVPESLSYRQLLQNTAIAASSTMFDRSIAGDERFTQQGHEDYAFWLQMVRRHGRCFGLDQVLMQYRVVGGSVSSAKFRSILWVWRVYRQSEGLSVPYALWCLGNYAVRALAKRVN